MTTALQSPLVDLATTAIIESENTKFPMQRFVAKRFAQAAITSCRAEEMRSLLLRLVGAHLGNRVFDEEQTYEVWREAVALLAMLDGRS